MNWIAIKDEMPTEYRRYLVARFCSLCLEGEQEHGHIKVYTGPEISIASWSSADKNLVSFYHARGDHSWDYAAKDHWTNNQIDVNEITHWMKFPLLPNAEQK